MLKTSFRSSVSPSLLLRPKLCRSADFSTRLDVYKVQGAQLVSSAFRPCWSSLVTNLKRPVLTCTATAARTKRLRLTCSSQQYLSTMITLKISYVKNQESNPPSPKKWSWETSWETTTSLSTKISTHLDVSSIRPSRCGTTWSRSATSKVVEPGNELRSLIWSFADVTF